MGKELKDYLHLYLGCEIIGTLYDQSGSKGILTGVTNGGHDCEIQFYTEDGINVLEEPEFNEISEAKPILRPLSDMTEEEFIDMAKIHIQYGGKIQITLDDISKQCGTYPEVFRWQLSKSFDIFGLIEAGLAIDKATLT